MDDYRSDPLGANRKMIDEFRAARDRDEPMARPMLLLTTTGADSNQARTVPIMYVPDGDRLLVIGSNAGAPAEPAWVRNVRAHPRVEVEVGRQTVEAEARVTSGEERDQLFADIAARYPFFLEHQAGTERTIPVIVLTRLDGHGFGV
jgi:deazaflavin-dependent oxidoreductase (nitroreductase family)